MRVSNSYAAKAKTRAKARRAQRAVNRRVVRDFALLIIAALIFIGTGILSLAVDAAAVARLSPPAMSAAPAVGKRICPPMRFARDGPAVHRA